MRLLWLFLLPALFLPNFGRDVATSYGTLELSDFLIGPYIALLFFSRHSYRAIRAKAVIAAAVPFILWSVVCSIMIYFEFGYREPEKVILFSLLKIGKFALYAGAGLMTSATLVDPGNRRRFDWALIVIAMVFGFSAYVASHEMHPIPGQVIQGFKAVNLVSVAIAVLVSYLAALIVARHGTQSWRLSALFALPVLLAGSAATAGRGGWVAVLAGLAYLVIKRGPKPKMIVSVLVATLTGFVLFATVPEFHRQILATLFPDPRFLAQGEVGFNGIDEGGRIITLLHELPRFLAHPVFGTGFFHRGGLSGLWVTGSHNFWVQIVLETGFIGGLLMLHLIITLWKQAGSASSIEPAQELAAKSALVAAIVGGMSGEYFYGGSALLILMLVWAPIGSLKRPEVYSKIQNVDPLRAGACPD